MEHQSRKKSNKNDQTNPSKEGTDWVLLLFMGLILLIIIVLMGYLAYYVYQYNNRNLGQSIRLSIFSP
jgi:cyanate permease